MKRPSRLTVRLAIASVLSATATAAACIVALIVLVNTSERTRKAVSGEIEILRDAAAFDALIYQKGFVAVYMLTRDPEWLRKLEGARQEFGSWLARVRPLVETGQRRLLEEIEREDAAYNRERTEALALFEAGHEEEAKARLPGYSIRIEKLLALSQEFSRVGRQEVEANLLSAERSIHHLAWLLAASSLVSALSSITVGFLWAKRIARPMYELQLKVESAAEKHRIQVASDREDLDELADHVTALLAKVEATDAALLEQRRRATQNEKMSAVGELATKLAHEILNPVAGIKSAVQLMSAQVAAGELSAGDVSGTCRALDKEVSRVEQLLKRLVNYARPLAPSVEVCSMSDLFRTVVETTARQLAACRCSLTVEEGANVPPLEMDPLLMTQVLVNLVTNAAQAMTSGGAIALRGGLSSEGGRRHVVMEVTDEGPGIPDDHMAQLFKPFFTTRREGHGLGLATSHHIVLEHGGAITGRNRTDRPGAIFEVRIPVVR
jgi:signal transduction histidine kinase